MRAMKVAAWVDFSSKVTATATPGRLRLRSCRSAHEVSPDTDRVIVDLDSSTLDAAGQISDLKF